MKSTPTMPLAHRGFTLVELLVVFVIIAVLATLGLMGTRKLMDNATKTRSIGNLKQLATTCQMFSADNNGALVHETETIVNGQKRNWCHHLLVSLRNDLATNENYKNTVGDEFARSLAIFSDPKALKKAKNQLQKTGHNSWRTYAYNNRIGAYGQPDPPGSRGWGVGARYVYQVETPEKLILHTQKNVEGNRYSYLLQPEDAANGKVDFTLYTGSVMISFHDGHVEMYSKKNFPTNGGINPNTKAAYTSKEMNEFWLGRATSIPAL
jgi:prepilin-type N-terminal cleavage/methylation domain-containing protein